MKNDKLLAKYLGKKVKEFSWQSTIILISEDCDPLVDIIWENAIWQPGSNWNQLMLVVEKIEEEMWDILGDCEVKTEYCPFSLGVWRTVYANKKYGAHLSDSETPFFADTKIQAVYNACVEYVENKT